MSAVDDVDARLCRLDEALQLTQTHLLELSTQRMYNPTLGVDQDHSGLSVATLEVTVIAARNMIFQSGFLAGKGAYVRATLDPPGAALDQELKCTQKRAVAGTPCWQETLVFRGMTMLHSKLAVEVLQEERIGADRVVGVVTIDVSSLHDQRLSEKWHCFATKDNHPTYGQLYLSCRLNRSQIFALELESELLQNQIKELRDFAQRQRQFSLSLSSTGVLSSMRSASGRSLDGKEVQIPSMAVARTPPRRLGVLHSPIVAMRKRERRMSSSTQQLTSPSEMAAAGFNLQHESQTAHGSLSMGPRVKRRKLEPVTETHVESLSMRLANWLLPPAATSATDAAPSPIKPSFAQQLQQQQPFPLACSTEASSRRRPTARSSAAHKKQKKKSSALAAIEQWLFQDASQPTNGAVERVHAEMRAES